jgi:hypothetical protein
VAAPHPTRAPGRTPVVAVVPRRARPTRDGPAPASSTGGMMDVASGRTRGRQRGGLVVGRRHLPGGVARTGTIVRVIPARGPGPVACSSSNGENCRGFIRTRAFVTLVGHGRFLSFAARNPVNVSNLVAHHGRSAPGSAHWPTAVPGTVAQLVTGRYSARHGRSAPAESGWTAHGTAAGAAAVTGARPAGSGLRPRGVWPGPTGPTVTTVCGWAASVGRHGSPPARLSSARCSPPACRHRPGGPWRLTLAASAGGRRAACRWR